MTSKYGNVRTNGYASKAEAKRAQELVLLRQAGKITDLEEQREFVLVSKSIYGRALKYRSDFCYRVDGVFVCEDVKSPATAKNPLYRWKRRLMQEVYGITIKETS